MNSSAGCAYKMQARAWHELMLTTHFLPEGIQIAARRQRAGHMHGLAGHRREGSGRGGGVHFYGSVSERLVV